MLHELGVLHYLKGEYDEAVSYFWQVASNCQEYDETVREPSIFNLGHAYRKKRDFDNAALWYRAALAINPRVASTYSALGFTLHLKGDLDQAIELYHQSLSLKPDDTFTCEMLSEALKDILDAGDVTDVGSSMAMPGMSGMPGMPTATGERSSSVGPPMAMDVL